MYATSLGQGKRPTRYLDACMTGEVGHKKPTSPTAPTNKKNAYLCLMEYLSKQRYDEISAELNHLINEVYPTVQEDLAEASAQGDRSDNAGYREARRTQGKTISRIRFLQKILEHSRVIDPEVLPKDRVSLLSRVEFTNIQTNTRMCFQIVSPHEMDLEAGKISFKSPIGAALMGKKAGEIAEAKVPSGTLRLRIESITLD